MSLTENALIEDSLYVMSHFSLAVFDVPFIVNAFGGLIFNVSWCASICIYHHAFIQLLGWFMVSSNLGVSGPLFFKYSFLFSLSLQISATVIM